MPHIRRQLLITQVDDINESQKFDNPTEASLEVVRRRKHQNLAKHFFNKWRQRVSITEQTKGLLGGFF